MKLLVLPGDGVGPEVTAEAVRVLRWFVQHRGLDLTLAERDFGIVNWHRHGTLMPDETWAQIEGADAQWQVAQTLLLGVAGRGTIDLQHGGALRVGDALRIGREGTLTLRDGLLDATLLALDGGAFNFNGGRVQLTRVEGSLLNQGGTLAPGHSPGRTDITGDYTQGAAGTLEIELASADSFDVLAVAGSAHLDGKLVIKLTEGFDA